MQLVMANRPTYYAALGDSMSIDAYAGGPGNGAASLFYAALRATEPHLRLIPLATDGATSATVRFAQIPRLKEMNIAPRIATLTVGGNDFVLAFGDEDNMRRAHRALRENLHAILSDLRRRMPNDATIIVGNMYDPSDATNDAAAQVGMPAWPEALEWRNRFNQTIADVAAQHNARLADLHAHFLGHGLQAGDPAQGDARPENANLWYTGVIEPNAWGAEAIRDVFLAAVQ